MQIHDLKGIATATYVRLITLNAFHSCECLFKWLNYFVPLKVEYI